MRRSHWFILLTVSIATSGLRGSEPAWRALANPVVEDGWVRPPAGANGAKPVWGLAAGLRIGLAPLPGPRGLLRVYTPYVGQPDWRMINFIAVEPIVKGRTNRSFSELEPSSLARGTGKVMWSVDRPDDWTPRAPAHPARGVTGEENGVKTLTIFIGVEKFRSGAAVFLRLTFRADRPCEVRIATFTQPTSAPLAYCVVTATMGNYARLRRLHLTDGVVTARDLFADATFNAIGFAPHARLGLERLARRRDGAVILAATSEERDGLYLRDAIPEVPEPLTDLARRGLRNTLERHRLPHMDDGREAKLGDRGGGLEGLGIWQLVAPVAVHHAVPELQGRVLGWPGDSSQGVVGDRAAEECQAIHARPAQLDPVAAVLLEGTVFEHQVPAVAVRAESVAAATA